jgi:hypothetical protein
MRAALRLDAGRLADLLARQYLADGRAEHLLAAAEQADAAGGWREAIPWLTRAAVLQPISAAPWHLLRVLETANQYDAIGEVLATFEHGKTFGELVAIFKGVLLLQRGDPQRALHSVAKLRLPEIKSGEHVRARLCHLRAQAYEALGQYRDALKLFQEFNRQGVPAALDKRSYLATIERLARAKYPPLKADERPNHVMLLGFPRSGTTLLEHALAAHPQIETFEEIPSLTAMIIHAERALSEKSLDEAGRRAGLETARERYYDEIERRKRKPGAEIFVDKLPIRSAWIEVLEKFFPQKRYIFSVRHPYDVVLSCFKQPFTPNAAMENFRTVEDACEFYDRVMTIWFGVFPDATERVLYVRYDDLANNFRAQLERTLGFLGLGWNDEVLRFAELSETRSAATPSYGKVRGGLSLGAQSGWKNYRFVFDTPYGAKLHKWVDRFGYER